MNGTRIEWNIVITSKMINLPTMKLYCFVYYDMFNYLI